MARVRSPVEDVIRSRVEEHPDAVWLMFRDETYTWREVLSNIQRAANGLLDLGVRPGECVAIMMGTVAGRDRVRQRPLPGADRP